MSQRKFISTKTKQNRKKKIDTKHKIYRIIKHPYLNPLGDNMPLANFLIWIN